MFEFKNSSSQIATVSPDRFPLFSHRLRIAGAKFAAPFVNRSLELKSEINLVFLDDKMRLDLTKEFGGVLTASQPHPLRAMLDIATRMVIAVKRSAKLAMHFLHDGAMRYANPAIKLHSKMDSTFAICSNADESFTVEQSSTVSNIHIVLYEKLANSEKTQCPVERRGRVTPNQAGEQSLGVRREHVPTAKAKICSELHGNMQRSAEMTDPIMYSRVKNTLFSNRLQHPVHFLPASRPAQLRADWG